MAETPNPLDDLATQLQGRLTTLETLVTLLLSEKANATRLIKRAGDRLDQMETGGLKDASEAQSAGILQMMNAARWSLDGIAEGVRLLKG